MNAAVNEILKAPDLTASFVKLGFHVFIKPQHEALRL